MMLAKALASASASAQKVYVEDVFSTWLYTGNGSTQTITNGIDLSGKGGLVWTKSRSEAISHWLADTSRGSTKYLSSDTASGNQTDSTLITAFNNNGYDLGSSIQVNWSGKTFASWTFRKAPKFFDVVTWTGNGAARTISHNLGSAPGCVIVKRTDSAASWQVWHRSTTQTNQFAGYLNSTGAFASTGDALWGTPTTGTPNMNSSTISIGDSPVVNASGGTYVAYLFAHDAGGFGDGGNDNVISCGSFTTDGSGNATVTLGWEPQWVLIKSSGSTGNWLLVDNMRGWSAGNDAFLYANTSGAEITGADLGECNSTGFSVKSLGASASLIYIAIRRGPMKTPTDATKVFNTYQTTTNRQVGNKYDSNLYPPDLYVKFKQSGGSSSYWQDRIRGWKSIGSASTAAEEATTYIKQSGNQDELEYIANWDSGLAYANWYFGRAPGFFDVVAYTGTGSATTISHNLGVAPELMIVKRRSTTRSWLVYNSASGNGKALSLNLDVSELTNSVYWNNTSPTSSTFSLGSGFDTNSAGDTYIAYLFASCPGVSKVGSYTGTGTTLNVDCGFTAGARFVLIKRTDSTGDWYVWDTARGIVSGNDPYLLLNSTAAEVTSTDYIDPLSSGFQISSTAPAAINASGGSFIFLAIA